MVDIITITEQLTTLPKAFKRFKDMTKSRDQQIEQIRYFNHPLITPADKGGIPSLDLWLNT